MELPPPELPPFFVRRFFKPTHDDSVPPPAGYDSWDAYWKLVTKGEGMAIFETPADVVQGNKCTAVWTRVGEDVATIGVHVVLLSSGTIIPFDTGAFERVEGNLADMWAALVGHYDPSISLDRFEWHAFGVDVRRPNPRIRETALPGGVPGTADADTQLPPQVAVSVTLKTAARRVWGRVFMPAPVTDRSTAGRILPAFCADVRAAWGTLLDDQADHESPVVIWSPRHGGGPLTYGAAAHAAGDDNPDSSSFARTVDQVQVDDLWDVVRSRRYDRATVKETHTVA